jgi:hypothetical protein
MVEQDGMRVRGASPGRAELGHTWGVRGAGAASRAVLADLQGAMFVGRLNHLQNGYARERDGAGADRHQTLRCPVSEGRERPSEGRSTII